MRSVLITIAWIRQLKYANAYEHILYSLLSFLNEPSAAGVSRRGWRWCIFLFGSVSLPLFLWITMVLWLFVFWFIGWAVVFVVIYINKRKCDDYIQSTFGQNYLCTLMDLPTALLLPPFRRCRLLFLVFSSNSLSLVSSSVSGSRFLILFLRAKTLSMLSKLLTLLSLSSSEFLREELVDALLVSSSEMVKNIWIINQTRT